jgi:hypothetical protein
MSAIRQVFLYGHWPELAGWMESVGNELALSLRVAIAPIIGRVHFRFCARQ